MAPQEMGKTKKKRTWEARAKQQNGIKDGAKAGQMQAVVAGLLWVEIGYPKKKDRRRFLLIIFYRRPTMIVVELILSLSG